ncbi:sodium:proton antiporter [Aliiglaciecola sp. CAU 1673]|uniref:cation:proton antiporter n=1 Tax=Aliiglaciecola sp. CAU 1673 TaxID=3032595 RepID=UPI0023DC3ED9|nr:sodium:proton antiporter [Aliiglaciecola sp. CAU 1673]MDF2180419.1 sodium:proton antiporter [Aliiglaciecola sp. CAU 1673]
MITTQWLPTLLLIFSGGVLAVLTSKITRMPLSLHLLLWGMLASYLVPIWGLDTGIRYHNFQPLILFILIPILVFEAALNLPSKVLRPHLKTTLFSASLGVVLSATIAAAILYFGINHPSGFPWMAALLAGVVITATDPVAVVAQLKEAKASPSLAAQLEGESLFNDATVIVLFSVVLGLALEQQFSVAETIWQLVRVLAGGVLAGALLGFVAGQLLRHVDLSAGQKMLVCLLLAYGAFFIAESLLHVSGVFAVLVAALQVKKSLIDATAEGMQQAYWDLLAFIANVLVFFLMGLVVTFDMFSSQWLAMLLGILAAMLSRLIGVYFSFAAGKYVLREPVQWRNGLLLWWGGLRGVISIALVLSLPLELETWWTIQSIGFAVVLFSLTVQALSYPWLLNKLR